MTFPIHWKGEIKTHANKKMKRILPHIEININT